MFDLSKILIPLGWKHLGKEHYVKPTLLDGIHHIDATSHHVLEALNSIYLAGVIRGVRETTSDHKATLDKIQIVKLEIPNKEDRVDANGHVTRYSDSSLYDERCVKCGATDGPGDTRLMRPCTGI